MAHRTVITSSPEEAAEFIRSGGVAAFPTETVYGLGANVFDEAAISKIFAAKGRPADNPLIVHVADISQVELLASDVPDTARSLIDKFFPGPLTLVLPKAERISGLVSAGLDTIGVRMPRNELAVRFLRACGTPVAAPSANLSGRPSPTTWEAVRDDLDGRIDCILKGEATEIGLESTVVDCTAEQPLVLRSGAVSFEELRRVVPEIGIYEATSDAAVRSPGMKHRHYSPSARVVLIDETDKIADPGISAYIGISPRLELFAASRTCRDSAEYAREVFAFFRECDRVGIRKIYCERVDEHGIGRALMDRLRRAAEAAP